MISEDLDFSISDVGQHGRARVTPTVAFLFLQSCALKIGEDKFVSGTLSLGRYRNILYAVSQPYSWSLVHPFRGRHADSAIEGRGIRLAWLEKLERPACVIRERIRFPLHSAVLYPSVSSRLSSDFFFQIGRIEQSIHKFALWSSLVVPGGRDHVVRVALCRGESLQNFPSVSFLKLSEKYFI